MFFIIDYVGMGREFIGREAILLLNFKSRREFNIYLAAFVDGEGSFSIHKIPIQNNRIRVTLRIGNTDYKTMFVISKNLGSNLRRTTTRKTKRGYYIVSITGRKAVQITKDIFPFLIAKRRRAKLILRFPTGKIGVPLSCKDAKKRIRLSKELSKLNKRKV